MKNKLDFHFKGYDRVRAIHKIRQSINKFGDKLGKKNKILNGLKRKDIIGNEFINLTISKIKINKIKPPSKITLLDKKVQNSVEKDKKEESNKKNKINKNEIKNLLEEEKIHNENEHEHEPELLSNSYDYKIKETDLFSQSNKKNNNDNQILNNNNLQNFKNNEFSYLNLIQNMKRFNIFKKNKTYSNNFYNLLNKGVSPINNNYKYDIQDENSIIKSKLIKTNYNNIYHHNKMVIPKFRSLGTKANKVKPNCKIIKLGRNFSTGNIKQNETNIKTRTLFYNKYKKKRDMKLTKIKVSKTQIDIYTNENYLNQNKNNLINFENTKNFGQQTMIENKIHKTNYNLLRRIYSYIRLPNINRINFPEKKLNLENNDCGTNFDFCNNNYFYLKDIKNQSINKIYMINPYIRNKIINNLN